MLKERNCRDQIDLQILYPSTWHVSIENTTFAIYHQEERQERQREVETSEELSTITILR